MMVGIGRASVVALAVAVFVVCFASQSMAVEFLANPGFEESSGWIWTGAGGDFQTAFSWNYQFTRGTNGGNMLTCEEDWYTTFKGAHSGARAWYCSAWVTEPSGRIQMFQDIMVPGGGSYVGSVWVLADDVNADDGIGFGSPGPCYAKLILTEFDVAGNPIGVHASDVITQVSAGYQKLMVGANLSMSTFKVRYELDCVTQGGWATGGVYWDDASLSLGTIPEPGSLMVVFTGVVGLIGLKLRRRF